MELRGFSREAVTCVTIRLDCPGTEGNRMYETAIPNWGE